MSVLSRGVTPALLPISRREPQAELGRLCTCPSVARDVDTLTGSLGRHLPRADATQENLILGLEARYPPNPDRQSVPTAHTQPGLPGCTVNSDVA